MPKKTKTVPQGGVSQADLTYAIGQLVKLGRTTTEEILRLAGDRESRIRAVEAELAALRQGLLPAGDLGAKKVVAKAKKVARPAPKKPVAKAKAKPAPKTPKVATAKKIAATKAGSKKAKVGDKIVRKDGRVFTNTKKAIAARRLQGQYIGNLRKVAEKDRDRFRTMAKEQGVAAAVEAIMGYLG
jgi:hypothetical protein